MALVNRYVMVQYDVPGPVLWHERWALEHIEADEYVVVTPDDDVYVEELSVLNQDLRGIRVRAAPGAALAGIPAAQLYELPAWAPVQVAALRAEALRVAADERRLRGGGGQAVVAQGAGGAGIAAAAAVPSHPAGVLRWLAAECVGTRNYGDEVVETTVARVRGAKHVQDLGNGVMIFVECVDGSDLKAFRQRAARGDARVLEQKLNSLDQAERSLQDIARECAEVPAPWSLPGPRTSKWCINYLAVEGLGFEGHHERLRQICKVDSTAWGIAEHFQVSMALRHALCVDQLNGTNLLSVEIQFRRLQTIEFSYAEKARENENRSMPGKLSLEEQSSFGGVTRQFSTLMICPSLLEHVKSETEKEAVLAKSLRKAREERDAAKKTAGKKKAGGDDN